MTSCNACVTCASKAYRWGRTTWPVYVTVINLASALALWNGKDPILKERAFGLIPAQGNHGEDVKDYYFGAVVD